MCEPATEQLVPFVSAASLTRRRIRLPSWTRGPFAAWQVRWHHLQGAIRYRKPCARL